MSLDRVVLGADAVTVEDGIREADHAPTRLKWLIAGRGKAVYERWARNDNVGGVSTSLSG
ncbi:hypothetical protein [Arthrobacter sp. TE12232]